MRKDVSKAREDLLSRFSLNAMGEMVLAGALNVYWEARTDLGEHAPVAGFEVRTRPSSDDELIIKPDDRDEAVYVLVVQKDERTFRIVGKIRGSEAKQADWWRETTPEGPGWVVPQSALQPFKFGTNFNLCQ